MLTTDRGGGEPNEMLPNRVVEYAIATTASTREFMEQNPDKKLPSDYTKYPGKVDHTSCACVKVGKTSFKDIEQTLDGLIIRCVLAL